MKPLSELSAVEARRLEGILFDLDDTVLTHGLLTREAYDAIWALHEAGIKLVAVTGRPSGWAELLVRQWPIDGAVSENGAVFVVRDDGVRVLLDGTAEEVAHRRAKLDALVARIREELPSVELADDVAGRRSDTAWDISERRTVPEETIARLAELTRAAGARTTRSSVHFHASFERDDKASGAVRFLHERFKVDPGRALTTWAFVGDSSNDAACFSAFRTTFAVANVCDYVRKLSVLPRYVAAAERGAGFAEIARVVLSLRQA